MTVIANFPRYELWFDDASGQPEVWSCWGKFKKLRPNIRNGYLCVGLCSGGGEKRVTKDLHRIVALSCLENPDNHPTVDHIDGNKLNNSLENLRWANNSTQQRNKPSTKGYCWNKAVGKWMAYIGIDGRLKYLGLFTTESEARAAYCGAHNLLFSDVCVLS